MRSVAIPVVLATALVASCGVPSRARAPEGTRRGVAGDAGAPTDVTFYVASDFHFGYGYPPDLDQSAPSPLVEPVGIEQKHTRLIRRLNALAGHSYPDAIGGRVGKPRGLVVPGDLTEWGRPVEWWRFVSMYGLRGNEGPLHMPVFEMIGNHDKVTKGPWVEQQVAERHGGRFYAWDWDALHLVALEEAPDDEGMDFLERDLARLAPKTPVILFLHYALAGMGSDDNWFDEAKREHFADVLRGHNIVAIFHGHDHEDGHYLWHGIDVWRCGSVKYGARVVQVVHATDSHFTVATYQWLNDSWGARYAKALAPAN